MTDNEVVKALECCIKDEVYCDKNCAGQQLDGEWKTECRVSLMKLSLDLINRQKAEIERLKEKLNTVKKMVEDTIPLVEQDIKTAKSEAYKECIEKVRKLAVGLHPCSDEMRIFDSDLDNLLNELVGEEN